RPEMSARGQESIDSGDRRNIRRVQGRIGGRNYPGLVAKGGEWRAIAVGDAECGNATVTGADGGIDSDSQAASETDGDQQSPLAQQVDLLLQISGAARRGFGVEAEGNQPVGEVIGERSGEVGGGHQDSPGAIDTLGDRDYMGGVEF